MQRVRSSATRATAPPTAARRQRLGLGRAARSVAAAVALAVVGTTVVTQIGAPTSAGAADVVCPSYSVMRVAVNAGICELEREVVEELAAERGVVLDAAQELELYTHARATIKARLLLKLVELFDEPSLDATEAEAYDWLADRTEITRRDMAQRSIDRYQSWSTDPCAFTPPTGFDYTPPETLCADTYTLVQIFQTPRPPTFEEFVAYGAADVLSTWGLDDLAVDSNALASEGLAPLISGALAGGASVGALVSVYAIAGVKSLVLPFAGTSVGAGGLLTGGLAAGAALIAVVSIVLLAVSIVQAIIDFSIPVKLAENLDDVTAATSDPASVDIETVVAAFLAATSGPYSIPSPLSLPDADDAESVVFRSFAPSADDPDVIEPTYDEVIEYYDWTNVLRRAWVHDRWWISEPVAGGERTLSPMLQIRGPANAVSGITFDGTEFTIADIADEDDVLDCPGADCVTATKFGFLAPSDEDGVEAVLDTVELSSGAPVITSIEVPSEIDEGEAVTYRGEATDPDGDAVTYTWIFDRPVTNLRPFVSQTKIVGQEIEHRLWGDEPYDVILEVSDPSGATSSVRSTVTLIPETLDELTYTVVRPGERPGPIVEGDIVAGYDDVIYREPSDFSFTNFGRIVIAAPNGTQIGVDYDGDGNRDDFRTVSNGTDVAFPLIDTYLDPPVLAQFADDGVIPITVTAELDDTTIVETYPLEIANIGPTDLEVEIWDPATSQFVVSRPSTTGELNGSTVSFPIPDLTQGDEVRIRFRLTDPGPDDVTATIFWIGGRDVVEEVPDGEWQEVRRRIDIDQRDPKVTILGVTVWGPLVVVDARDDGGSRLQSSENSYARRIAFFDMVNVEAEVRDLAAEDLGDGRIRVTGALFDQSIADIAWATIDWGDGTTDTRLVQPSTQGCNVQTTRCLTPPTGSGQLYPFDLEHQYANGGDYTVTVETIDGDPRETNSTSVPVSVASRLPVVGGVADAPDTVLALGGLESTIAVVVTDPDDDAADLAVTIDLGDGPEPATYDVDREVFVVDRTFAGAGIYDVTIVAEDHEGVESEPFDAEVRIATLPDDPVDVEVLAIAGNTTIFTPTLLDDAGFPYPTDPSTWVVTDDDGGLVDVDIDETTGEVTVSSTVAGMRSVRLTVPTPLGDREFAVSFEVRPGLPEALDLAPSVSTVVRGGSITLQVDGVDEFGNTYDVTDEVTLTSDVATDVIDGATVTFPTASPHTITATHPSGATASVVITVMTPEASTTTTMAPAPTTEAPATTVPDPGGAPPSETPSVTTVPRRPGGLLPSTGSDVGQVLTIAAAAVFVGLVLITRRRRRAEA